MRFKFRYVFIAFGTLSAGCALHEVPPKAPVLPAAFDNRSIENHQSWPSQDWYKGFGSPELQALIDQAAASATTSARRYSKVACSIAEHDSDVPPGWETESTVPVAEPSPAATNCKVPEL